VKGPDIAPLRDEYAARAASEASNTMDSPAIGIYKSAAQNMSDRLPVPGNTAGPVVNPEVAKLQKMLADVGEPTFTPASSKVDPGRPGETQLGFNQALSMKRAAQHEAGPYDAANDTLSSTALKGKASVIQHAIEAKVAQAAGPEGAASGLTLDDLLQPGSGATVQSAARGWQPTNDYLSPIIEASEAANKHAARISRNRSFSLSDTVMASGAGAAAGAPGAVLGGAANKAARTFGGSTVSVTAAGARDMAQKLAQKAIESPQSMGKFAAMLQRASAKGPDSLMVLHHVLGNNDPDYQALMHAIDEDRAQEGKDR
jgi:hypothetical protein